MALRLLRAAIHTPAVLRDLIGIGTERAHFLAPTMQLAWDAMVREHARAGRVDPTFLRAALHNEMGATADEVVTMILEAPPLDDGTDVLAAMMTLRRRVALYRLRQLGGLISKGATAVDADPGVVAGYARHELDAIVGGADTPTGTDGRGLAELVGASLRAEAAAWESIPLGLPEIDRALGGGIPVGRCSIVMAGSGVGKTTYARHALLSMARHLAPLGEAVLYVTFESDRHEVARETVQMMAGVRLGKGDLASSALGDVAAALEELPRLGIVVEDGSSLTVDGLCSLVRAHKHRRRIKAVVVDYVQDLALPERAPVPEGHARNSRLLRGFAAREQVAMLWLSQISADASAQRDKSTRIRQEDTAGSRQYAKDAPVIVSIERKHDSKDPAMRNISRASLLKNRMMGELVDQWMKWDQRTTRLTPCDESGATGMDAPEPEEWGDA